MILTIVAIIAAQKYLGLGEWLWWLFGIEVFFDVLKAFIGSKK